MAAQVVVIGAGPAGLMAAWRAARAGGTVTVLDRADRPGGMAGSFEIAGQSVDFGSHRLHPATPPDLLDELRELLGTELQTRPRHGRIRLADRWLRFPLRTADLITNLPRRVALGAVRDVIGAPLRRARSDDFAARIRAGLGPTVAAAFYEPYARKLWDTDPGQLSGELARRRVSARGPADLARRLVRGARPEGRTFLYPRRGYGQIAAALAAAATDAGATITLGRAVTGVDLTGSRIAVSTADGTVTADMVWSTIPLSVLVDLVSPQPPPAVVAAAASLRYRAMALVYLVCNEPRYTEFDAHYFPGPDTPIARLSEPKNYRDGPDPAATTVLCAELPCWAGDELWQMDDDDLGTLVARSLVTQGLPPPERLETVVVRLPRVYPVFELGYERRLAPVTAWAAQDPRLISFGRQGLFVPDNLHHALAMGAAAAASMDDAGGMDQSRWAASLDDFATHVVED